MFPNTVEYSRHAAVACRTGSKQLRLFEGIDSRVSMHLNIFRYRWCRAFFFLTILPTRDSISPRRVAVNLIRKSWLSAKLNPITSNRANKLHLTNRRHFSMVYTLIDHKMTSKNVQNSSGTTSRRRVVSLPSFEHFMASFYGL